MTSAVPISCVTWLVSNEWNKEAGKLEVGDEVTVFGEKSGELMH